MKEEKVITPANGYLMLFIVLILFFGGIGALIAIKSPLMIIAIVFGLFLAFGFIMVQPNGSRVLLLFGKSFNI